MVNERVWCDGVKHRVMVEVVTFIETPDQHFIHYVEGEAKQVASEVAKLELSKSPGASMYLEYCCDKCKEVTNG